MMRVLLVVMLAEEVVLTVLVETMLVALVVDCLQQWR
jgi:hypothetical protein